MSELSNLVPPVHRLVADLLDPKNSVSFRPALARSLGATAALFLSQAIYWQKKKGIGEWFYKNRDAYRRGEVMIEPGTTIKRTSGAGEVKDFVVPQSWEWELGLSRSEQETARKKLVKLGLLEEKDQGIPCKKHFRVNFDKTIDFLLKNQQLAESCQLDGEIQPTGRRNSTNRLGGNTPTITKTTSKITSKITPSHPPTAPLGATCPSTQGDGGTDIDYSNLTDVKVAIKVWPKLELELMRHGGQVMADALEASMRLGKKSGKTEDLVRRPVSVVQKYLATLSTDALIDWGFEVRMQRERETANANPQVVFDPAKPENMKAVSTGKALLERFGTSAANRQRQLKCSSRDPI